MTSSSSTVSDGLNFVSRAAFTTCIAGLFAALGGFTVKLLSDKTGLITAPYCLNPLQGAVMWATALAVTVIVKKHTNKNYLFSISSVSFIVTSLLAGVAITKVSIAAAAINVLVTGVLIATAGLLISKL